MDFSESEEAYSNYVASNEGIQIRSDRGIDDDVYILQCENYSNVDPFPEKRNDEKSYPNACMVGPSH